MSSASDILILDDKPANETMSSASLIRSLNPAQRNLINYQASVRGLWALEDDKLVLVHPFHRYQFVFIHDSFNDPLFDDSVKPLVIEQLSRKVSIVLFSGSKIDASIPKHIYLDEKLFPGIFYYEILRRNYVRGLVNFLNSKLLLGDYDLKYLFNSDINPLREKAVRLLSNIRQHTEDGMTNAIDSVDLRQLLELKMNPQEIETALHRFQRMEEQEFLDTLDYFTNRI